MDASRMTTEFSVEDVMQAWPETLRVFLRRRMACVGCEAAPFHTVGEAARIYGIPAEALLAELRAAAAAAADRKHGAGRKQAAGRKHLARRVTPRRRSAPARAD